MIASTMEQTSRRCPQGRTAQLSLSHPVCQWSATPKPLANGELTRRERVRPPSKSRSACAASRAADDSRRGRCRAIAWVRVCPAAVRPPERAHLHEYGPFGHHGRDARVAGDARVKPSARTAPTAPTPCHGATCSRHLLTAPPSMVQFSMNIGAWAPAWSTRPGFRFLSCAYGSRRAMKHPVTRAAEAAVPSAHGVPSSWLDLER
jgi:hypothetical protein